MLFNSVQKLFFFTIFGGTFGEREILGMDFFLYRWPREGTISIQKIVVRKRKRRDKGIFRNTHNDVSVEKGRLTQTMKDRPQALNIKNNITRLVRRKIIGLFKELIEGVPVESCTF